MDSHPAEYEGPGIHDIYDFRRRIGLRNEDVCALLSIPPAQYRRGSEVQLSPESIAILEQCDVVYERVLAIENSDPQRAKEWFLTPHPKLNGEKPAVRIAGAGGIAAVASVLATPPTREAAPSPPVSPVIIEQAPEIVAPDLSKPPGGEKANVRIWRIKGQLKSRCAELDPAISLAELGRRVQKSGLSKFSEGQPARLELGRADASWEELLHIAEILKVSPFLLAGLPEPVARKPAPAPIAVPPPLPAPVVKTGPVEAPSELPPRIGSPQEYRAKLAAMLKEAEETMRLPQKVLPPAMYRGWRDFAQKARDFLAVA